MAKFAIVTIRIVLCVVVLVSASAASAQTPFYRAPLDQIAGAPGTLIRQEAMMPTRSGATAYRVLYRSVGLHGEPIAVSGVIIVPPGSAPPGGRPIVAWAHPTTGVTPRCAPSLALFVFQQIQGLREMTEQGFIVAATDYPGLGTPETHPYLVGDSEARAVIDSVRVARALTGAPNRFAVWGHSQGGQAALFTGLIAKSYAPELDLVGVAAAAPATELRALLADDINSAGGRNLAAMTLWSWSRIFGAPTDRVVDPAAMPVVDLLAGECIESIGDILLRRRTSRPLEQRFLSMPDFYDAEPWRSLMTANTPGTLPSGIPLLLAQGGADGLVRPQVTEEYMRRQCATSSSVQMVFLQDANHGVIAHDAAPTAVDWMNSRFAGAPAPSDCGRN
jgi:pimeloyl-ACP methyl ester carboxylesterase